MTYQERTITCQDCGQTFVFSAEDQAYHAQKGFTNEPKRCPSCRTARRNADSGGYGASERQMHPVVCAQCNKETTVPFKPSGDRPVYCSDCFSAQRQSSGSGYGNRSGGGRRNY